MDVSETLSCFLAFLLFALGYILITTLPWHWWLVGIGIMWTLEIIVGLGLAVWIYIKDKRDV